MGRNRSYTLIFCLLLFRKSWVFLGEGTCKYSTVCIDPVCVFCFCCLSSNRTRQVSVTCQLDPVVLPSRSFFYNSSACSFTWSHCSDRFFLNSKRQSSIKMQIWYSVSTLESDICAEMNTSPSFSTKNQCTLFICVRLFWKAVMDMWRGNCFFFLLPFQVNELMN